MAFTLWNLFEATILVLNAACILHEERFLAKIGWGSNRQNMQGFGEEPTVKLQILNLVHSIRTVVRCLTVTLNSPMEMQSRLKAATLDIKNSKAIKLYELPTIGLCSGQFYS